MTNPSDFAALQEATRCGDLARVKSLLDGGVDQNTHPGMPREHSPLMHAAYRGYVEIAQLLIQHGANVNFEDGDGFTALTLAAGQKHWEIAKACAAAGGDVTHIDASGVSALRAAEKTKNAKLIAYFRERISS